jgi:putative transposase
VACRLFGISRQGFYQKENRQHQRVLQLQQVKQMVVDQRREMPRLGGRKVYYLIKESLQSYNIKLGRDGLFDFLRSEHMLIKPRKSYTKTTWSKHWLRKHPNLLKEANLTRSEQVWVSDITYIPTKEGNTYLSLITDAYSRKIVGHHLSDDLRTEGVSQALQMAIKERKTRLPLIHHSDRGLQYCSAEYQQLLSDQHIQPSMTDGYDCYQNALAERINGILKDEFLLTTCKDRGQLCQVITESIQIYNTKRPHMKLSYKTPTFIHEKSLAEISTRDL